MKQRLKNLVPRSAKRMLRRFWPREESVDNPKVTRYPGTEKSVLECQISYNKYGGYCVPRSSMHRPAAQKILKGDVWEPDTIEFMTQHAGNGDVVHAGTYFGDFLPGLSRSLSSNAKLWAFEPNPENFRCAQMTSLINGLDNVEIRNAGLGIEHGKLDLVVTDARGRSLGGMSRIVDVATQDFKNTVEIEIVALDRVLPPKRSVSIIQLDVEGFEQQALSGAMETIRRWEPILILENLPSRDWLEDNILSLGYRVNAHLHENKVLTI